MKKSREQRKKSVSACSKHDDFDSIDSSSAYLNHLSISCPDPAFLQYPIAVDLNNCTSSSFRFQRSVSFIRIYQLNKQLLSGNMDSKS